jgi:glucose/arabinose dehydrogenase
MRSLDLVRRAVPALLVVALLAVPLSAATLPPGFSETLIAGGLQAPTAMAIAPDGRVFVCEQAGTLRVIRDGALLPAPFVNVTVSSIGERGLLGVAFDPDFAANGYVYVYYTATSPVIHNRVSRFTAAGDIAQPGSEIVLLDLEPLGATNHNGGAIHFGKDGKLYVGVGENAVPANAQLLTNRLGKILRINSDGTIPADNPFYTAAAGDNRSIWALGLRNPYTFAFEPLFGGLFINDVGQNAWEEVNQGVGGSNYGWPATEGPTSAPGVRSPLYAYGHGSGCAISGGAFHDMSRAQFPMPYWGSYFFADLCGGWIRARRADGTVVTFATNIAQPVDLKMSGDGSLYYLARGGGGANGVVYRIAYTPAAPTVDIRVNGGDAPQVLGAGQPLQIAIGFNAGAGVPAAEVYVAVAAPFGLFWLDPATGTFLSRVAPVYAGPLGSAAPSPLFTIADVSALPPGPYWWFTIVDRDSDGVPDGDLSDFVLVVVR